MSKQTVLTNYFSLQKPAKRKKLHQEEVVPDVSSPTKARKLQKSPERPQKSPSRPNTAKKSLGLSSSRRLDFGDAKSELPKPKLSPDLPIPSDYQDLAELFRTVDSIMALKTKSKGSISQVELSKAVQIATKKVLKPIRLKQMYCVFPMAYNFNWKNVSNDYQLFISPNFEYGALSTSARSNSLNPKELVARRNIFKSQLLRLVKDHHDKFLKDLAISVQSHDLTKWHQDFDVERCPEINTTDFPHKPEPGHLKTMSGFLSKADGSSVSNKRLIEVLAAQAEKDPEEKAKNVTTPPKLSQKGILLDILSPTKVQQIQKSPLRPNIVKRNLAKISPRKLNLDEVNLELPQPTLDLPIPSDYRDLAELFRAMDSIVAFKIKSRGSMSEAELKPAVEIATRKAFKPIRLKQIHCVFPSAYNFNWKAVSNNYQLFLCPNFEYGDLSTAVSMKSLSPKELVTRRNIFNGQLLRLVKDHHDKFLKDLGISVKSQDLTKWHKDFDVESCPEIDTIGFPPKPESDSPKTVTKFLSKTDCSFVNNKRLTDVLTAQAEKEKAAFDEMVKNEPKIKNLAPIKLKKGMEKIPQHLVEKILAKERAKQIRDMTETSDQKEEKRMLRELMEFGPTITNCYKSESHRLGMKGLNPKKFFAFCSKSVGGMKSEREVETLVRYFIKNAPEFLHFLTIRGTEYIKESGKAKLERERVRNKIQELLKEKEKVP